jgi:mono/diheme cytochrome c family protein
MLTKKIACPSCGVGLKVADDLEPDTRIKCPKCKSGFAVPGDKDEEPAPRAARSRKPAPPPEDDEPDEDVRERRRPARKPRRKKPEPSKAPLIVGLIVGLVLLLGGGGALAAVLLSSRKKADPVAENKAPVPPMSPGPSVPVTTGPAPGTESAFAAGRKVYEDRNCGRCHTLGAASPAGGGGRGGRRKVDLSRVGASHTVDWISDYIRDPKAQNPMSHMPAFRDKIQPQDLRSLAEFLASLK